MKRFAFVIVIVVSAIAMLADSADARGRRRRCKGGRCGIVPTINVELPILAPVPSRGETTFLR